MSIDMGQADRTLRQQKTETDDGVFKRHRELMRRIEMAVKTDELIGPALDWAVAKCKGMLRREPTTAKYEDIKNYPLPFVLWEVCDIYEGDKFMRCDINPITVTRCGINEVAGATMPSISFTDINGTSALGSIGDYFLTLQDAEDEARLTESGGPFYEGYTPSTDWAQAGPIIEREGINLVRLESAQWEAWPDVGMNDQYCRGPTPLIAAMRCYVASKLGDEVDVPDELLQGEQA
jgi:hypothetical protein